MGDSTDNTEQIREVIAVVTRLYEDARARTDVIRGIALAAMGVLSVLVALTDLESIVALGTWAILALGLIGVGLVSSLTVLFKSPVMVPYDSEQLAQFVSQSAVDPASKMLAAVTEAEVYTRTYNKRAALLVNFTLAVFVAAVIVLVFQVALGPAVGMGIGAAAATVVIAGAFLARKLAFAPTKKGTRNE